MNRKRLLLILVLLIGIFIIALLIYNNKPQKTIKDNKLLISKEDALKLIKEKYKIDNSIYQYDKKQGDYHIIKTINNPSIEYWVDENTGDIIIQACMSFSNITNNE